MKRKAFFNLILILMASFINIMVVNAANTSPTIDNNAMIIKNVKLITSGNELIKTFNYDNSNIQFYHQNSKISSNRVLTTGDKMHNKSTDKQYKISIRGDVLGEGKISIDGIKKVAEHIIKHNVLEDEFLVSADYNSNGSVKMNDVVKMLKDIDKNNEIINNIPKVKYTKSNTGKFVFVNNPETIDVIHLADTNNRLFYKDSFKGNMELYYEHIAQYDHSLGSKIYYLIRFYNPGSTAVTLTINKSGNSTLKWSDSTDDLWTNTWKEYYNSESKTFTIGSKETLKLYHTNENAGTNTNQSFQFSETEPSEAIIINSSFDGVLNMTSSGTLNFEVLAYKNSYNSTLNATYPGNDDDKGIKQYTGYVNHSPNVYNNISFTVNDSIKAGENLKVNVNNILYDSWVTNTISSTIENAYINEMLNLIVKPEHEATFTMGNPDFIDRRAAIHEYYLKYKNRDDVYELPYNIANWAVHYHENITLKNTGTKTRKISFVIKTPNFKAISIIPNYNGLSNVYKFINENDSIKEVKGWTVTLNPKAQITIPTEVILGGMSCGVFEKMIRIEE